MFGRHIYLSSVGLGVECEYLGHVILGVSEVGVVGGCVFGPTVGAGNG